jgi:hypothetical protein
VYVSDRSNQRVEVFTHCGVFLRIQRSTFFRDRAGRYRPLSVAESPRLLASSPQLREVYVTDLGHDSVVVFHRDGSYLREFPDRPTHNNKRLHSCAPNGVSIHEDKIYISERNGNMCSFGFEDRSSAGLPTQGEGLYAQIKDAAEKLSSGFGIW